MFRLARRFLLAELVLLVTAGPGWAQSVQDLPGAPPAPAATETESEGNRLSAKDAEEYFELYKMLADTIDQIERNYVEPVSRQQLMEAAIEGIVRELDPYSNYIPPEELDGFRTSLEQEFGGIGIRIDMLRGQLTIVSPLVGSPAYRAGLLAGDRIVEIDGTSTEGITIDEAIKRLKGPVDSTVTIGVVHPGAREPEDVVLKREMVHVATVLGDRRNADDSWNYLVDPEHRIGYVRITAFSRETVRELRDVLETLVAEKVAGLVVDVRFNPGGLLTSAIEASDLFIDEGTIVSTEGRNVKPHVWKARRDDTFRGFPVAVLVNRYSASASEILAACLQDHKRAVVVGERTWGKGSVQNVVELNGGRSALKLTTASYLRPSGMNIHRMPDADEDDPWGVLPDDGFEVRLSPQEIRLLSQLQYDRDIVRRGELSDEDAENDEDTAGEGGDGDGDFVDRQLQKAVEHLVAQLSTED